MVDFFEQWAGEDLIRQTKRGQRIFRPAIVHEIYDDGDGEQSITMTEVENGGYGGWTCGFAIPRDLPVVRGDVGIVGIDGFNSIGFLYLNGQTLKNFSDDDYEQERQKWLTQWQAEKVATLEANREDWTVRESYLSEPSRKRLEYFRANSEEDFDLEGWGYELTIAELTDALVQSNLEETDEIKECLAYQGCSGNQFGLAKALATNIIEGRDIEGTIGGLAPLTGKSFY